MTMIARELTIITTTSSNNSRIENVAVGDSQEFQEVSRPVSWSEDYLTGS